MFFGSLHGAHIDLKSVNASGMRAWGARRVMLASAITLGTHATRAAAKKKPKSEIPWHSSSKSCALRPAGASLPPHDMCAAGRPRILHAFLTA